jgi:hypothetical protein
LSRSSDRLLGIAQVDVALGEFSFFPGELLFNLLPGLRNQRRGQGFGQARSSTVLRASPSRQCRNVCSTVASVKISTASACTIRMWPLSGQRKKWQKLYSDQTLYGNEKSSGVKRFSRQCRNACSTVASVEIEKIAAADPTGRGKVVRTPALAKCWMNGRLFTARWVRAARLRKDCKNCCPRHCP